ncbi:hypothetical protein BDZ89DRAFT_1063145 [Hymenopellis radicata]|nr:hypothetical protein BDZ89DRAFT_1063145 [Hymenopellis radicata]
MAIAPLPNELMYALQPLPMSTASKMYSTTTSTAQHLPAYAAPKDLYRDDASTSMPLTPPLTGAFERRALPLYEYPRPTLPSIAQFDHQISVRHMSSPLTPPDDEPLRSYTPAQYSPIAVEPPQQPTFTIDWRETRSAHFIAEKTCEMICYLWFSRAPLQLSASPNFVRFMQKLLETTQVSHSVVVLALHYIYRLKEREKGSGNEAQPGSEFRIAVAGLMMANKFLDDNTYTNRTWSDVSGISLAEINRMEREFLQGVDYDLYVDKRSYEKWLWVLKGLVLAKEKAKGRRPGRARSTSPHRVRTRKMSPHHSQLPPLQIPSAVSAYEGIGKRSAETAFSPAPVKVKLPKISTTALEGFGRMSLDSPARFSPAYDGTSPARISAHPSPAFSSPLAPPTLVSACRRESVSTPENLYFYTLRGKLMYHHPQYATTACPQSSPMSPPPPLVQAVELPPLQHPQPVYALFANAGPPGVAFYRRS